MYAIPKFADYSAVWKSISSLTPLEMGTLIAATIFNLFTYWWANMAALPGMTLGQSAVSTQTATSVANTLPGGGAIAVGLTYTILRSWGFSATDIALYVGVSGIWNIFIKLALPVLSIVFLVIQGGAAQGSSRPPWSAWWSSRERSCCSRGCSRARRSLVASAAGSAASCQRSGASSTKLRH